MDVEYASVFINRYFVGKDGKTAYERLSGKKSKMLSFEFGERVPFRRIPLARKAREPLADGTLRGNRTQSGEYVVANSEGACRTRTMKRIPETERWDNSVVEGMPWAFWKFKASGALGSWERPTG